MKLYSETPNPSEDDLQKFLTTMKEMESIVTASEFKNTADGRVRRVPELKQEETKQDNPHFLCGKAHKKGQCAQICKGCKMKGSHKEEQCWVLHPQLRPKDFRNGREGKDRGRKKDRSRSKSREGEEERKKRG